MPKTELVQARLDARLKAEAEAVLEDLGLSADDVIRGLYRRIATTRALPFDVKVPNAETREAIEELEAGRGTRYEDFDEFAKAMMGD